jgi:hypothetical protein
MGSVVINLEWGFERLELVVHALKNEAIRYRQIGNDETIFKDASNSMRAIARALEISRDDIINCARSKDEK